MSTKHHNQGQSDGASGKYNPPHSILDGLLSLFTESNESYEKYESQNESYRKGWKNGNKSQ